MRSQFEPVPADANRRVAAAKRVHAPKEGGGGYGVVSEALEPIGFPRRPPQNDSRRPSGRQGSGSAGATEGRDEIHQIYHLQLWIYYLWCFCCFGGYGVGVLKELPQEAGWGKVPAQGHVFKALSHMTWQATVAHLHLSLKPPTRGAPPSIEPGPPRLSACLLRHRAPPIQTPPTIAVWFFLPWTKKNKTKKTRETLPESVENKEGRGQPGLPWANPPIFNVFFLEIRAEVRGRSR